MSIGAEISLKVKDKDWNIMSGEKIENFEQFCNEVEKMAWDTETIFRPVDEWHEEDGCALFFKLDAGEPPVVTSPICSDWDGNYFTHWMPLPIEFRTGYRMACIKSGIKTEYL